MKLRTLVVELTVKADLSDLGKANDEIEDLGDEANKADKKLGKLERGLDDVGDEAKQTSKEARGAAKSIDRVGKEADQAARQVGKLRQVLQCGPLRRGGALVVGLGQRDKVTHPRAKGHPIFGRQRAVIERQGDLLRRLALH